MSGEDNQAQPELKYHLIFDTNGILSVKWSNAATFHSFMDDLKGDSRLELELIAFRPVFEEWRKHFIEAAAGMLGKHKRRAKALGNYFSLEMPVPELTDEDIEQKSDAYIAKLGIKVVEADVSEFPTLDFFSRANEAKPPFENQDKGFRDAVIATAIIAHVKANPEVRHLVLCNDKTLTTYIEELLDGNKNFKVVPNLDKAESELNLALSNLDLSLGDVAKEHFAGPPSTSGIYFDLGVEGKIQAAYEAEYPDPDSVKRYQKELAAKSSTLTPVIPNARWETSGVVVKVIETTFVRRDGNKLYWESDIGYTKTYKLESSSTNIIMSSPGTVDHSVVYAVGWSTEQQDDDYFVNPALEGAIEKIDDIPRYRPSSSFYDSMSSFAALNQINSTITGLTGLDSVKDSLAALASGAQTFQWPQTDMTSAIDAINSSLKFSTTDLYPSLGLSIPNTDDEKEDEDTDTDPPSDETQSGDDDTPPPVPSIPKSS